jgi:hypothetical protein
MGPPEDAQLRAQIPGKQQRTGNCDIPGQIILRDLFIEAEAQRLPACKLLRALGHRRNK